MIKFGTGGWRAIIGDDFTKQNIQTLAKALATKMKDEGVTEKGIVMGYDRRFLSKEAMQWAAVVFATEGIKAYLINKSSPTPLVMFYVMKHEFPYGMMITASHNPAIYNGIKVFTAGGRDADEFQTKEIEEYIQAIKEPVEAMEYEEGKEKGLIEEIYPLNEYIDSIMAEINMEAIRSTGLRVALDPMYGVSETSLRIILQTARCEVETIHDRHDTLFGGKLPSPSAATLHQLQNFVVDRGFDIGIEQTVMQTVSELLTIPESSCIQMKFWYCYITIWKNTKAGTVRSYGISVLHVSWIRLQKSLVKNAMKFQLDLSIFQLR